MFSKLVRLANKLDEAHLYFAANQIDKLIEAKIIKSAEEKDTKPDIPDKVVEIADAIRRDDPDVEDGEAYAYAWETYCSYVNPSYEGCTEKGKSKRKSPKSDYEF